VKQKNLYVSEKMQVDASCLQFRQDWVQLDDAKKIILQLHIIRMVCILFHSSFFFSFFSFFCKVGFRHI
jgi:hypothetical protein